MKVEKTIIEGVYIVTPKTFGDNRGWFMESYSANRYKEFDNLLHGTITGQRWSSNWLSRTDNSNKNGQVCPKTA